MMSVIILLDGIFHNPIPFQQHTSTIVSDFLKWPDLPFIVLSVCLHI